MTIPSMLIARLPRLLASLRLIVRELTETLAEPPRSKTDAVIIERDEGVFQPRKHQPREFER